MGFCSKFQDHKETYEILGSLIIKANSKPEEAEKAIKICSKG